MILIRFAIGTFSFALLGMAFALAPAPSQHHNPIPDIAVVINR